MNDPLILLSLEKISFKDTLKELSFEVKKGEFIALFGPNGGGKTTLIKVLLGLLPPTSGKYCIPESTVIGYVPQTTSFDRQFPISVRELALTGCLNSLTWYGTYPKETLDRVDEVLASLKLDDKKNIPFHSLSGGWKQRVLIARALVENPDLLLLDEPTANIDPKAKEEIHAFLQTLLPKTTIIMVTHDIDSVLEGCSRLFCLDKTLEIFKPKDVCRHFSSGLYHKNLEEK